MATWKRTIILLTCSAGLLLAAMPQDCHATFFKNWFKRRSASTVYRPQYCSAYGPQAGSCGSPGATTCRSCVQTCPQTVVQYVPQTCYRTVWNSVPVTHYRPVTTSDPGSGCQTTCMRPCTSHQWQARRVPYTTYRPVYSQIQVSTPVAAPYYNNVGMVAPGLGGQAFGNSGCSTCGTGQQLPYASAAPAIGAYTQPLAPMTGAVNQPYAQPYNPQYSQPVNPTPAQPADQQPSLTPSPVQGSGMRTQPMTRLTRPMTAPAPAATAPTRSLQPVPDLDSQDRMRRDNGAPRLLNPNDQTAARPIRQVGLVVPIQWSKPIESQDDDEGGWDDSGWTTAAP